MDRRPMLAINPETRVSDQEAGPEGRTRRKRRALTPPRQRLAMRFVALAKSLSRPYKLRWPTFREEFEGTSMLALVEAAESFDPTRAVRFATFAQYRISGALRTLQSSIIATRKPAIPGGPPILPGDLGRTADGEGHILGIAPDPPVGWHHEAREVVDRWLRGLPARYAAACREIYVHGRTQVEAARVLGLSQSRLSDMHQRALEMLHHSWRPDAHGSDGAAA